MEQARARQVRILKPPGRWPGLQLGELREYRDLLYILAWRDVVVRYKQAVLGHRVPSRPEQGFESHWGE